ncbi:hypothetical protein N7486_000689 [Penicillium sp. IBT 16267x]|nr:hypothetical protein N7486_000689 [Penicillium sp. IBT 16267x]
MKLSAVYVVLGASASLGLALPIQESILSAVADTALSETRGFFHSPQKVIPVDGSDSNQPSRPEPPTFQQYTDRHRQEELGFIRSNEKEFNLPGRLRPTPSQSGPFSTYDHPKSASSYGIFLGKWRPFKNDQHQPHQCNPTKPAAHTVTYLKPLDLLDIMENYGPVCVALAIFVLVPIAYFVLELLEITLRYFVREQFPQRGRDRLQLLGPERQLRAMNAWQREKIVEKEKRWWQARRARY